MIIMEHRVGSLMFIVLLCCSRRGTSLRHSDGDLYRKKEKERLEDSAILVIASQYEQDKYVRMTDETK